MNPSDVSKPGNHFKLVETKQQTISGPKVAELVRRILTADVGEGADGCVFASHIMTLVLMGMDERVGWASNQLKKHARSALIGMKRLPQAIRLRADRFGAASNAVSR